MKISEVKSFEQMEFDAVKQLLLQLVGEEQLPTKEHFIKLIESKNSHLFIAKLKNAQVDHIENTQVDHIENTQIDHIKTRDTKLTDLQIVGTMTIATYEIPSGKRMWIEDVVVDSGRRGKGIGQELIEFAVEYCKAMGGTDIRLTSRPARVAANQLYQKLGFNQVETNVYLLKLSQSHH